MFLATAATVIASQALISAAFSVTKQAIQLGILPRMAVRHTSVKDTGQIYVPFINWSLYVFIVLAVALFKSSSSLASAYGIAVTLDMTITTVMTFYVHPLRLEVPAGACDTVRPPVSSSSLTSPSSCPTCSSWWPVAGSRWSSARGMFVLMLTWKQGRTHDAATACATKPST